MHFAPSRTRRAARWVGAGACAAAIGTASEVTLARGPGGGGSLEIASRDGRSWDAILREIQSDPGTEGRTYAVGVLARGVTVDCGDYDLSLDPVATRAFAIDGCDEGTGMTRLRVADRSALFAPGDVVPQRRTASIRAALRQIATASGGGDPPAAGSKLWCSVALQPYLWDDLHGVPVPLRPDRFTVRTLDENVDAAPDGSGWIARGESRMAIAFHYEVIDRATGARVLEDVATLACADGPASPPPSEVASTPLVPSLSEPRRAQVPDSVTVRPVRGDTLAMDLRLIMAGGVFGPSTAREEITGVQFGAGKIASKHWYIGASGAWALPLDVSGGGVTNLFQVGPEVRYVFHEDTEMPVGRHWTRPFVYWTGLRSGYEELGPGSSNGAFAEAAWGVDSRTGSVDFGSVLGIGTSIDSAGAYRDASTLHSYIAFALRVGLNL